MKSSTRFLELDVWRGLAIIGMIIFHIFFALDFLGLQEVTYNQGAWRVLARLVQWSFLLLVGIGLYLSHQKMSEGEKGNSKFLLRSLKRALVILSCAALVSIATFLFAPAIYIRFGILHLIATSILVLSPFVSRPFLALIISALIYALSPWVTSLSSFFEPTLIFGVNIPEFATLDYFPIFPWMSIPALGVFLGYLLYRQKKGKAVASGKSKQLAILKPLADIGKKSLLIYMIHMPIIISAVILYKLISS